MRQFAPDALVARLGADPASVVLEVCRCHGGNLDSHALEAILVPSVLSASAWKKWWTKARTALRRCPNLKIDGQSFLPQLKGETGTPRESIYMWYSRTGNVRSAKVFARNQRYKLYESGRFYDVKNDRFEKTPLDDDSLDAQARAIKALLQARLDSFAGVKPPGSK